MKQLLTSFILIFLYLRVFSINFWVDSVQILGVDADSITVFVKIGHNYTHNFNSSNYYVSGDSSFIEVCLDRGFGAAITYFDSTFTLPYNTQLSSETRWLVVFAKGVNWDVGPNCLNFDTAYYSFQRPISPIKELDNNDDVTLYPNPVKETVTLNGIDESEIEEIHVYSILGKRVMSITVQEKELNLKSLTKGSYIVKVKTASGSFVKQILKE